MTRASTSSKKGSGKKHSKFGEMRKKLTLRSEPSPAHYETNKKEEMIPAAQINEDEYAEKINKEEGGAHVEDKNINECDPIFTQAKTKKLFQRASPMKLVRLSKKLKVDQKDLVRDSDYGGLLDIKCSKLHPELCQFLMDSFDANSCMLVFPGRGSIPLNEESVHKVLGVAWGNLEVLYGQDSVAIQYMARQLGNSGGKQPTIASLEEKLVGMKKADRKFLRLYLTYAMTSVLAPTTGVRISPRVYPSLVNINQAKQLNMCKFVLMIICKALKSGGKGNVAPCMLYLMVKYLDSLKLEGMNISDEGTRVAVWTNAMVTKAIKQDIGTDGRFGAAPLKPEFASIEESSEAHQGLHSEASIDEDVVDNKSSPCEVKNDIYEDSPSESEQEEGESILFSDPEKIAKFIRKNTPKHCTTDDKAKFRECIEYACHGFEASLRMLVRNLAGGSVRQHTAAKDNNEKSHQETKAPTANQSKSSSNVAASTSTPDNTSQKMESVSVPEDNVHLTGTAPEHQELFRKKRAKRTLEESSTKNQDAMPADGGRPMMADEGKNKQQQPEMSPVLAPPTQADVNAPILCTDKQTVKESVTLDVAPPEHKVTEVTKTPTKTQVTSEGKTESDYIASLLRHMKAVNADTMGHRTKTAGNKENVLPHPIYVGSTTAMPSDTPERPEDIDGVESSDAEESYDTGRMGSKEFLKFVGMTPPGTKYNIPRLEEPVIFDIGVGNPAKEAFDEIRKSLKEIDMEEAGQGLPSMLDGKLPPECEKLLSEMEPKVLPKKRKKTVTFADQEPKRSKIETTTVPSPSKYRTRAAAREEISSSPSRLDSIRDSLERKNILRTKLSAGRSANSVQEVGVEQADEETEQKVAATACNTGCSKEWEGTFDAQAGLSSQKQACPAADASHRPTTPSTSNVEATASKKDQGVPVNALGKDNPVTEDISAINTTASTTPHSAWYDPMNRKIIFDSKEEQRKKEALDRAPDAPSFEILLDTPPDEQAAAEQAQNHCNTDGQVARAPSEQAPADTGAQETLKGVPVDGQQAGCSRGTADPSAASITPTPHEYQKRVSTVGKFEKSPYINVKNQKILNVTKPMEELYSKVCRHGSRSRSKTKDNVVIDIDTFFINLGSLADSVAPGKKLVNIVAEIGIHIIKEENQNPRKVIMPLRLATYLMDARFELKDVIRVFDQPNRLDQQDLVCFPVLRRFALYPNDPTGHYWVVVLNIPAERFEIIDSLAAEGEALMMTSCHILIAGIKTMWNRYYSRSKVQVANWPIEVISSPRQTNTYDCGFFTLKNLEEKHGRKVSSFTQKDLPNIRKLYTDKWLHWGKNKAKWWLYVT